MTRPDSISSHDVVERIIDNGAVSAQQLLVVGLCMFFNVLDGFDITAMAIVAGAVSSELGLQADKMGEIFSYALAGMMFGAMVLAPLSDIIGRRRLIIISLLLVGGSILLTARAESLLEFKILRFISGAGAGTMLAAQATLAAEYSSEKYRSLSVVAVTAGYPLGAMFTSIFANQIIPEFGWRGMFWFGGGVTVAMAVVAILLIPESLKYLIARRPKNALKQANKILKKMDKPQLAELPAVEHENRQGLFENFGSLVTAGRLRMTLVLWLVFFLCFMSLYFLLSWLPLLLETAGYSESISRDAFLWLNLGGFLGILALGILSTNLKLTNLVAILLVGSGIAMLAFALLDFGETMLLLMIFIIGLLLQGGFTGMYGVAAKAYPTTIRSTGVGWAIGLGRFGAVIGPLVAGHLINAEFGVSAIFLVFAVPITLGGLVAYTLHVK